MPETFVGFSQPVVNNASVAFTGLHNSFQTETPENLLFVLFLSCHAKCGMCVVCVCVCVCVCVKVVQ